MSDVWYAVPTMKQGSDESSLAKWRARGYKLAVYQDMGRVPVPAEMHLYGDYAGYASAVNQLCFAILAQYPDTQVIITGGDDIDPDPRCNPVDVEREFVHHFGGTFGVMQPTGDRWMVNAEGLCACERVLESPWMGREWIHRINGGGGPIWHEYFHFFEEEEHLEVAKMVGRLWLRPELNQHHHHWSREGRPRPKYLSAARLNWDGAKALYVGRKNNGFPGHEPVPEVVRTPLVTSGIVSDAGAS